LTVGRNLNDISAVAFTRFFASLVMTQLQDFLLRHHSYEDSYEKHWFLIMIA